MKSKIFDNKDIELSFAFKNCNLIAFFEEDIVPEEDQRIIKNKLQELKNIYVDKSYVDCEGNKHTDTFLTEDGWNQLKDMLLKTNYGVNLSKNDSEGLVETYIAIIKAYAYEELSKMYGIDILPHVQIVVKDKSKILVEVSQDFSNEWKNYPGKWQTWDKYAFKKTDNQKKKKE